MNPNKSDTAYEAWLADRREDFSTVDLSFLVMNSVRACSTPQQGNNSRMIHYLGMPSSLIGAARLILFVFLVLTPA
ncbi:MAG: hypothetical protein V4689_06825 [Verrucomicrobiota bacterium]